MIGPAFLCRRPYRLCRRFVPLVGDADRSGGAGAERLARSVQQLHMLQRHGQLFRGISGRLQLYDAVALAVRCRGRRIVSQYHRRHVDVVFGVNWYGELRRAGRVFRHACAAASATRQILAPLIGCSTPPAASPGLLRPIHPHADRRHAGRRHRGAGPEENLFLVPRVGGVAGAGVELALPSNWTARFEYLSHRLR